MRKNGKREQIVNEAPYSVEDIGPTAPLALPRPVLPRPMPTLQAQHPVLLPAPSRDISLITVTTSHVAKQLLYHKDDLPLLEANTFDTFPEGYQAHSYVMVQKLAALNPVILWSTVTVGRAPMRKKDC